ncbi:MAG: pyruvate kinase alpha/beta domain-containing protein [Chloroflexota bacterium]|nr:pyruvate kinase alpha/beta domain-containing protein [Chloroflexota bacterium]
MELKTVYFEDPERNYIDEVLRIVKQRADEAGIKTVLIASTSGATALKALDVLKGIRVIAVSHATGFDEPDTQSFTEENRKLIESKHGTVLTATHAFAGVDRAARVKFNMYLTLEIIANTLRLFGDGMKVAVEIVMMAADAGLVNTKEDVIAIAGRHSGTNTAIVVRPVNTHRFFDLKVKEILCKPHF